MSDVFVDAHVYMEHATRAELELDDIRLAIQGRVNYSYTELPTVETLLEMSNAKNSMALLLPFDKFSSSSSSSASANNGTIGVLLPPEKFCLSQKNFHVDASAKRQRSQQPIQQDKRLRLDNSGSITAPATPAKAAPTSANTPAKASSAPAMPANEEDNDDGEEDEEMEN